MGLNHRPSVKKCYRLDTHIPRLIGVLGIYLTTLQGFVVQVKGLEPLIPKTSDFKSDAYTNSATPAYYIKLLANLKLAIFFSFDSHIMSAYGEKLAAH